MGNASASVARGHFVGGLVLHRSVRRHLSAGVTVASAGIIVIGLVAAPPDIDGARTEVGGVRLAAFALPPAAPPGAIAAQFTNGQARAAVPLTQRLGSGSADINTAAVATAQLEIDPAEKNQQVNNAVVPLVADGTLQ